jgi:peptidoglycan/LPS O-acetylase OafA/YrhL
VLLHHLSMTIPAVSDGYDSAKNLTLFSPAWWLVASPLKIFVAGPEFVLVFFVLSGFVLTLSPLARLTQNRAAASSAASESQASERQTTQDPPRSPRRYDWVSYYPRRIVRLGVPVVASMVLAVAIITTLPHPAAAAAGSWLQRQSSPDVSFSNLLSETLLIVDPSRPGVNPPLWSLTWEMWFSILLPVAVFIALWTRRFPMLWAIAFCGVSMFGYIEHNTAATFLPAFALGALLGANAERIHDAVDRWRNRTGFKPIWAAIAIAGPMLSISFWMLRPLLNGTGADIALAMRVPGAVLMVGTVAFWPAAARVFDAKPLAGLGRISFSVYLVHSPFVVAFGLMFTGAMWWVGALSSVAATAVLALLMYGLVEKPSQRLASWLGARVSATLANRPDYANSRISSTSTGASSGSTATPTALRAWMPASPKA